MNTEDLYRLLRTDHINAQGVVDTVGDPLLVLDSDLRVQSANQTFFETFKVDPMETLGQPLYALGKGQWDIPELRRLLEDVIPKSTAIIDYEVEHEFPDLGRKVMLLTARTLYHPDTASRYMLLVIADVTERSRGDAAKDLLFGELRHRMANMLSVAQSIARQTTAEGRSAVEYRDAFLGRFETLILSQELAFSEQDEAGLKELSERIFAPFSGQSSCFEIVPGPAAVLGPKMIMALSLVMHEMATNAAKYGALSVAGGKVHFRWCIEDGDCTLRINWVESGGPPATPPESTGYGTKLVHLTVTSTLGGRVDLKYLPEGLQAEFIVPLGCPAPPGD